MIVHLFDDHTWSDMLPLTHTIPLAELRCGIYTATERIRRLMPEAEISYVTQPYLQTKYPRLSGSKNLYLSAKWLISKSDVEGILGIKSEHGLRQGDTILAFRTEQEIGDQDLSSLDIQWAETKSETLLLEQPWDIFLLNEQALQSDWEWMYKSKSYKLSATNTVIGDRDSIYIEEGAKIEGVIFQPMDGKIYISSDTEIMPGTVVRGSLAMLPYSQLKISSKIYGATTIGPYCKVGGEVNNSVFNSYSNKGHDGFLGNSVIGSWCNFGADSNNSNLKNNYDQVKIWSERQSTFVHTGQQFCGLIMGDHSKCGINTMFNTGTVVGVSCNIYGAGFPRNFVPSYSWGGPQGYSEYKIDKALNTASRVMSRRGIDLTEADQKILNHVFLQTQNQRKF